MNKDELIILATKNISDILRDSIKLNENKSESVLVIYDTQNGLTNILTAGYKNSLKDFYKENYDEKVKFLDFDKSNKEEILGEINKLKGKDLVVMIQTTNFRLDDFRIRLHLFSKKLKTIEHMHLNRNDESVWDVYVNSLEYDKNYYYNTAHSIKNRVDNSSKLIISSGSEKWSVSNGGGEAAAQKTELVVTGELEESKLNIGDYSNMENVGGTFPIGEVFTESKKIESLNGEVYIYAYADKNFNISMHSPFKIKIESGMVVSWDDNTPKDFVEIISLIKEYERPMIREIGFGLNRAITKERYLGDITAFERIYGMHLSLGEKHSVYKKEGMMTNKTKFHVDIFPVVDKVISLNKNTNQEEVIFEDGKYTL